MQRAPHYVLKDCTYFHINLVFNEFYTCLLDDIYTRSVEQQCFPIIWVLGEPKHLVQPQYHSYRVCGQLSKSMENCMFFGTVKGPVDLSFTP